MSAPRAGREHANIGATQAMRVGGHDPQLLDGVPVYNVSVPVMGQDFWIFD
jgi:hypothetical protein